MLHQKIERGSAADSAITNANQTDEFSYLFSTSGKNGENADRNIIVRRVRSRQQRFCVESLINKMYSWRGYGSNHSLSITDHCTTFAAYSDESIIGTLTLTIDSVLGLASDMTFHEELNIFRQRPQTKICELSKFAFDCKNNSKNTLVALFHSIFLYGSRFDCTDLFIEVNPRHVRFYKMMLGFRPLGDMKVNTSVNAPSQLMWIKVSDLQKYIEGSSGVLSSQSRSLYPLFLAPKQQGVART